MKNFSPIARSTAPRGQMLSDRVLSWFWNKTNKGNRATPQKVTSIASTNPKRIGKSIIPTSEGKIKEVF